jgi:hypothetical protein
MFCLTETRLQNWRALAVFSDGAECLLCVGRSTDQVRAGYLAACAGVLDAEEVGRLRQVRLQRWEGTADRGRWITRQRLEVPAVVPDVA